ncbi:MAG: hypothetical protein AAB393_13355, partial [Bacteroidota bacterium]
QLDSKEPKISLKDYIYNEARYRMLAQSNPGAAAKLLVAAEEVCKQHWHLYEQLHKQANEQMSK